MKLTRRQSAHALLAQGVSLSQIQDRQPELAKAATAPARKHAQREQPILNAILQMLRLHPKVAWVARINSGAYKTPDGRYIRFGFPGCPDVLGQMRDGRILMIEVKAHDGRVTPEQAHMISVSRAYNGVAGIARSVDEALEIVERG